MEYIEVISPHNVELRKCFVSKFVDRETKYYKSALKHGMHFDGWRYKGYLWEALKSPSIITRQDAFRICEKKDKIYIMWDTRTMEKVSIRFWYNKSADMVIQTTGKELINQLYEDFSGLLHDAVLPSEIYIYDITMEWYVVFTIENMKIDNKNEYMCLTNCIATL